MPPLVFSKLSRKILQTSYFILVINVIFEHMRTSLIIQRD
jgi:hypothetical protein